MLQSVICTLRHARSPSPLRGLIKTATAATLMLVYLGVALHLEALLFGFWIPTGAPVSAGGESPNAPRCACCKSKPVCRCHHGETHSAPSKDTTVTNQLPAGGLDAVLHLPAGQDFSIPCFNAGPCGTDQPQSPPGAWSKIEHLPNSGIAVSRTQSLTAVAGRPTPFRNEQCFSRSNQPADKVPIQHAPSA